MLKERASLANKIEKKILFVINKKSILRKYSNDLFEKYNISKTKSHELITLKKHLQDESDFIVFCFADVILDQKEDRYNVEKWYTQIEIGNYSQAKYKEHRIQFPIRFNMVQISDNQWIGRVTVKELMELSDAQLINYNENAQRTMQHVINGGVEYYRITLNRNAVKQIRESYKNGIFIPNTITLNIPETVKIDYENGILTINEETYFDILDGYHRFVALSNIYNVDPSFDYVMELRLVQFEEDRAKQFIYQEDQKTKMSKVDSNSFNVNSDSNKIVMWLNSSTTCNLAGKIHHNGGIVNPGYLGHIINVVYFIDNKKKKENEQKDWIEIRKEIRDKINELTDENKEYREKQWDYLFTVLAVFGSKYMDDIAREVPALYDYIKKESEKYKIIYMNYNISRESISRLYQAYQDMKGGE